MLRGQKEIFPEKVLKADEIKKLIDYAKDNSDIRDYLPVSFLYQTGVRVAEVVNIVWGDFFKNASNHNFVSIIGKGGRQRNVYVSKKLYDNFMICQLHGF